MDLSKEYILMCEKAAETQTKDFNAYACLQSCYKSDFGKVMVDNYDNCFVFSQNKPCYIWLPRQDQLQEMVRREHEYRNGKSWQVNYILLFSDWIRKTIDPLSHTDISAEILSLMYVMALKFNKQWNGQDWEEMK
ncbi:MAG: hypothetical protein HF309_18115 [Ignavibacteria bacterium]|jgi:hypothetical protein|nr:hypothetical protein [Ignavibacteria bacterium]